MSHVQVAVLCDEGASSSTHSFVIFHLLLKVEKKHHGTVDKPDVITFCCVNNLESYS